MDKEIDDRLRPAARSCVSYCSAGPRPAKYVAEASSGWTYHLVSACFPKLRTTQQSPSAMPSALWYLDQNSLYALLQSVVRMAGSLEAHPHRARTVAQLANRDSRVMFPSWARCRTFFIGGPKYKGRYLDRWALSSPCSIAIDVRPPRLVAQPRANLDHPGRLVDLSEYAFSSQSVRASASGKAWYRPSIFFVMRDGRGASRHQAPNRTYFRHMSP